MKKMFWRFSVIILIILSCNENKTYEINPKVKLQSEQKDVLLEDFSKALIKVLQKNVSARILIRNEALKKIDKDYDVIYDWIKDLNLEDGKTLESHICQYMPLYAHD